MLAEAVEEVAADGGCHARFCTDLYRLQYGEGTKVVKSADVVIMFVGDEDGIDGGQCIVVVACCEVSGGACLLRAAFYTRAVEIG